MSSWYRVGYDIYRCYNAGDGFRTPHAVYGVLVSDPKFWHTDL